MRFSSTHQSSVRLRHVGNECDSVRRSATLAIRADLSVGSAASLFRSGVDEFAIPVERSRQWRRSEHKPRFAWQNVHQSFGGAVRAMGSSIHRYSVQHRISASGVNKTRILTLVSNVISISRRKSTTCCLMRKTGSVLSVLRGRKLNGYTSIMTTRLTSSGDCSASGVTIGCLAGRENRLRFCNGQRTT